MNLGHPGANPMIAGPALARLAVVVVTGSMADIVPAGAEQVDPF